MIKPSIITITKKSPEELMTLKKTSARLIEEGLKKTTLNENLALNLSNFNQAVTKLTKDTSSNKDQINKVLDLFYQIHFFLQLNNHPPITKNLKKKFKNAQLSLYRTDLENWSERKKIDIKKVLTALNDSKPIKIKHFSEKKLPRSLEIAKEFSILKITETLPDKPINSPEKELPRSLETDNEFGLFKKPIKSADDAIITQNLGSGMRGIANYLLHVLHQQNQTMKTFYTPSEIEALLKKSDNED